MRPRTPDSAAAARRAMELDTIRGCKRAQRADALEELGEALRGVDRARQLGAAGQVRGRALRTALRRALAAADRYDEVR